MQSASCEMKRQMNHKQKIARRNTKDFRYVDDTTLIAESEEELKSFLMRKKEESGKAGLNSTFKNLRSWHVVPSLHGK